MTKMEFASMLAEEAKKGGIDAEEDYIFRADGTYIAVILKTEPGIPAPRIPVDRLFEDLEGGMPLEKVKEDFVEKAKIANEMTLNGVNEQILSWDWAKDRLVTRLVPADREGFLDEHVHRPVWDTGIEETCSVLLDEDASTVVTASLLGHWQVTEEELFRTARGNSVPTLPKKAGQAGPTAMTVLTTHRVRYGAGAILYNGVQEKLDALYPGGFYLIPSSIHEWIAVGRVQPPEDFRELIGLINRNVVGPDEALSGELFTMEKGILKVV